jgi:hypothetical protein|tara:strand:- start:1600 stop:1944 length:345 start_codon:yes stop_codon:yes gene_type:complete
MAAKAGLEWKVPFGKYKWLTLRQILTDVPEEFVDPSIVRTSKLGFALANGKDVKFDCKFNDVDYVKWLGTIIKQGINDEVLELIKDVSKHSHPTNYETGGDMHSRSDTESHLFS